MIDKYHTPEDEKIIFTWIDKIVEFMPSFQSDSFRAVTEKLECCESEDLTKSIGYTMLSLNILEPSPTEGLIQLSDFGRVVKNHGNYSKYLASLEDKKMQQITRSLKEMENLNYSIAINKWLLRTKWLPHVLSILALIISLLALFL
jgi:hypothetical protein